MVDNDEQPVGLRAVGVSKNDGFEQLAALQIQARLAGGGAAFENRGQLVFGQIFRQNF